jgi:hypothetical protein
MSLLDCAHWGFPIKLPLVPCSHTAIAPSLITSCSWHKQYLACSQGPESPTWYRDWRYPLLWWGVLPKPICVWWPPRWVTKAPLDFGRGSNTVSFRPTGFWQHIMAACVAISPEFISKAQYEEDKKSRTSGVTWLGWWTDDGLQGKRMHALPLWASSLHQSCTLLLALTQVKCN